MKITKLKARQILDSRGNPTVEVDLYLGKHFVRASAPSGASTGKHEAVELRDKQKAFNGKGVLKAVKNINTIIARKLKGKNPTQQEQLDNLLLTLDNTKNKSKLGANATTAVSIAICKAGALKKNIPLYKHIQFLSKTKRPTLPVPSFNIINGGAHASNNLSFQEYMIVPYKAKTFHQALQMGTETFHILKKLIKKKYKSTGIGDEGGFAPEVNNITTPLTLIQSAINKAGYKRKISINIDVAASGFFTNKKYKVDNKLHSTRQLLSLYKKLIKKFPITSIEDPFHEEDFTAFAELNKMPIQVVGDDLTVTNLNRIQKAIKNNSCSALLVKPNQIGTVTETLKALSLAKRAGWKTMVSHRSGETTDTFIADLAVGTAAGQFKAGAPCRGERVAKYNRLLRIEEERVKYTRNVLK